MPTRFDVPAALLKVLIGQAGKARPRPCVEGLYTLSTWRRLWEEALAGPVAPVGGRVSSRPSTNAESRWTLGPGETGVCPYKGLAAFGEEDADWFSGASGAQKHCWCSFVVRSTSEESSCSWELDAASTPETLGGMAPAWWWWVCGRTSTDAA